MVVSPAAPRWEARSRGARNPVVRNPGVVLSPAVHSLAPRIPFTASANSPETPPESKSIRGQPAPVRRLSRVRAFEDSLPLKGRNGAWRSVEERACGQVAGRRGSDSGEGNLRINPYG